MKCPKCQFENPSDSKFCKECGTQIIPLEDIPASPTKTIETPTEELTRGTTFAGRYEIIEELGKGGMGKVYRVEDKKIKEEVALKLIKPEIASDKKTIERFSNELRMTRKISHRNVCRMYDLGEEKGIHYITMEYVPGEDLKSSIRRMGPLTAGKTLFIAKQVCEGLAEAHRLGVIHRDLKPQNIMIDKDGNARIMDFGIARSLKGKGITGAGVMIGTPEYMSPEQVEGKEVDQRSDIYSLGVNLYEMVTGQVPFEGDTPFTIGVKHKSEIPRDPKELNAQIPEELSSVIMRCLEKDKEKRYQSAGEVRSELINIEKGIPTTERVVIRREPKTVKIGEIKWRNLILYGGAVILLILLIVAGVYLITGRQKPIDTIAVLPFAYTGDDSEMGYISDGITESIINSLSQLPKLKKVIARSSVFRYKGKDIDPQVVGQELGVDAVLISQMSQRGDELYFSVELVNTEDNSRIWGNQYNRKSSEIFAVKEEISSAIADSLNLKLTGEEKQPLAKRYTENLEAYQFYLKGRFFWNKRTEDDLKRAINYFEKAIEKDSNYALAYSGLADSYVILPNYSSFPRKDAYLKAKETAIKAIQIDDTLGEAHASLASIKDEAERDWVGAEREFKRAIELNPSYATAHHWYAYHLLYLARFDEAIEEIKRALELDPLSLAINRDVGLVFFYARKYDQAIEISQKTLEIYPNLKGAHSILGGAHLFKSMYEEALAEYKIANFDSGIGIAYAKMGKIAEAQQMLEILKKQPPKPNRNYNIARMYFSLGDNDQGFTWLERAHKENEFQMNYLKVYPLFDNVRSDPRFIALLKKMNLE